MSERVNGKLEEPPNNTPINTELFYYQNNGLFIVHGAGTFDNKDKLKKYGDWHGFNKTWHLIITKEKLLEEFPNIIEKQK